MDYEKAYKELVKRMDYEMSLTKENMEYFKEPEWPDLIDDRKKVIQFRNGIFDSAFEKGRYGAFLHVKKMLEDIEKEQT